MKRARTWRRFNDQERELIARRFKESGLTRKAFCHGEKIGLSTLSRCVKQATVVRSKASVGKFPFVEVNAGALINREAVELRFPSGLILSVRG